MENVSINKIGEGEHFGNRSKVFSLFGLQLCISSQKYFSEDGIVNRVLSYSLLRRVNKDGTAFYKKKTKGFKIAVKGRHVWGGVFSRTQTFKRIAE